jgi:hypothetical protein
MVRRLLVLVAVGAGGCSEYGVLVPTKPEVAPVTEPTTAPSEPEPTTEPLPPALHTGLPEDTGTPEAHDSATEPPPVDCYEPAYGYATSPSVRLFTTDATTPVVVSLVLSDTGYDDTYTLDAPVALTLRDAWATAPGTADVVGPFAWDAELTFGLDVHDTGDHWQSGPASRNADGVAHVAVTYEGDCSWLIGFEDLFGGGDLDYNDVVVRVEGRLRMVQ